MIGRSRIQRRSLSGLGTFFFLIMSSSFCHSSQILSVTPTVIEISSFFGGAEVMVSADIPMGCHCIVEVIGKEVEEDLMRKGRRWDIWMNVGEIDIEGAPCLYMLKSSDPRLLETKSRPWGYESLRKGVTFRGRIQTGEKPELFREFIHLKEGQGLYGRFPGTVKISSLDASRSVARAAFRLPARIPEGTYRVCLSVIKDGQAIAYECNSFKVVMVGLPAFFVFLASRHMVFYAILSITVAVAGGFLSGLLFRTRRERKFKENDQC